MLEAEFVGVFEVIADYPISNRNFKRKFEFSRF